VEPGSGCGFEASAVEVPGSKVEVTWVVEDWIGFAVVETVVVTVLVAEGTAVPLLIGVQGGLEVRVGQGAADTLSKLVTHFLLLLSCQYFSNVHHALTFSLSPQPSLDVHQAAGIGYDQCGSLGLFEVGNLAFQEFRREFGMFHREDAAEAAAIFPIREFDNLSVVDGGQQGARLPIHAQAA